MSFPDKLKTYGKITNMKNILDIGIKDILNPKIKSKENEDVKKYADIIKDKPEICMEFLSVAIFHQNLEVTKLIIEKNFSIICGPLNLNALSFYNATLPENDKNKLTDSNYIEISCPYPIMAGIGGSEEIFDYLVKNNLITESNIKERGPITLTKKYKNILYSNIVGACSYYGNYKLLKYLLEKYRRSLSINYVSKEQKSKNNKMSFTKELTEATPPLLACAGPASDNDTIETLKVLEENSSNFYTKIFNEDNIIHIATKAKKINTLKFLIVSLGLKDILNDTNQQNMTPFGIAEQSKNKEMIEFFREQSKEEEQKVEQNIQELMLEDASKQKNKKNKKKNKKNYHYKKKELPEKEEPKEKPKIIPPTTEVDLKKNSKQLKKLLIGEESEKSEKKEEKNEEEEEEKEKEETEEAENEEEDAEEEQEQEEKKDSQHDKYNKRGGKNDKYKKENNNSKYYKKNNEYNSSVRRSYRDNKNYDDYYNKKNNYYNDNYYYNNNNNQYNSYNNTYDNRYYKKSYQNNSRGYNSYNSSYYSKYSNDNRRQYKEPKEIPVEYPEKKEDQAKVKSEKESVKSEKVSVKSEKESVKEEKESVKSEKESIKEEKVAIEKNDLEKKESKEINQNEVEQHNNESDKIEELNKDETKEEKKSENEEDENDEGSYSDENFLSDSQKDEKEEDNKMVNSSDYNELYTKFLEAERKNNILEKENNELKECIKKIYMKNKTNTRNIPNNENNINILINMANEELENKDKIIKELKEKTNMLDLSDINNLDNDELKRYKNFYNKNLNLINKAIKEFNK